MTLLTFLAVLLVVGIFLYPTARTYYHAIRDNARLEAEYDAVIARNAALADDIALLQTDEGIVQEAREQLGWVREGENAVIVYGVEQSATSGVNAEIVSGSVQAPVTWYSPVLDVFFGYDR